MTAELHAHASLVVTGTAEMLDHGRDPYAIDELRIAAVKRRDGARLTAEISRLPKDEDDEGLAVDFVADMDRETLVRLGRLLLALADEREAVPSPMVALPYGDSMRAACISTVTLDNIPSGATLTVHRSDGEPPTRYGFTDPHEAEAGATRIRDEINGVPVPGGCAACPHATARFNGGNGATTCALLDEKIVAYGSRKPTTAPRECPRLVSDEHAR